MLVPNPFFAQWLFQLPLSQDCAENDVIQGLKVAVCASNLYFRTMRKHGVFIPPADRAVVVRAGEEMVDP